MVNRRPRVSVVLDPPVYEIVSRVSAVQGRSMSAILSEMVTELSPGLLQVAELGEALERLTEAQRADWRAAVEATGQDVAGPLTDAVQGAAVALAKLQELSEGVLETAPATPHG